MIFTDGVHLVSDKSLEELHEFAQKLGLKRHWFQGGKRAHPHYDLTTQRKVNQAIELGAKKVTVKKVIAASYRRRGISFEDLLANKLVH
jgi:hypothetical protein